MRRAIFVARRPVKGRAIRGPSRRCPEAPPPGRETRSRGGAQEASKVEAVVSRGAPPAARRGQGGVPWGNLGTHPGRSEAILDFLRAQVPRSCEVDSSSHYLERS